MKGKNIKKDNKNFATARFKTIDDKKFYVFRNDKEARVKVPIGNELVEINTYKAKKNTWEKPYENIPDEIRLKVENLFDF